MPLFHQISFYYFLSGNLRNYIFPLTLQFYLGHMTKCWPMENGWKWHKPLPGRNRKDISHSPTCSLPFLQSSWRSHVEATAQDDGTMGPRISRRGEPPLTHHVFHYGCTKPLMPMSFRCCFCNTIQSILSLYSFLFNSCSAPPSPQKTHFTEETRAQ